MFPEDESNESRKVLLKKIYREEEAEEEEHDTESSAFSNDSSYRPDRSIDQVEDYEIP